ncbi:MAG: T9SS type A sorting domain-containing protein [Bacteroidota bacterium]
MRTIAVLLIFYLSAVFCLGQSVERQVVATGGGSYTNGTTLAIDYTIGEIVISTISGSGSILTQGFQQPMPGSLVSVPENTEPAEDVLVFPNPANEQLHISISKPGAQPYEIAMMDQLGRLVYYERGFTAVLGGLTISLPVAHLATGTYFIRITSENRIVKTVKILKINQ